MELLSADRIAQLTGDQLDSLLESIRTAESQLKAVQTRVLREVDRRQIPLGDGMRTLEDWIVGRLDVTRESARKLAMVARADSADLDGLLSDGVSFDRVAELAAADETDPHLELDLPGLRSMLARRNQVTASDEQASFDDRFLAIQPTLDDTAWSLWGKLPALEGKHIADTLDQIADELPQPPDGHREGRATRRADALFVVCDRHNADDTASTVGGSGVTATVFIDATNGPARPGAWIASGPRVGLSTLERILCGSPIDVVAFTADGEPLRVGRASTAIPPATRRFVSWRDGGMCTADGCSSTYRLQPHHIRERTDGGDHHHSNLTSLCNEPCLLGAGPCQRSTPSSRNSSPRRRRFGFHHHVVIHGRGFRIDPSSPTRRRRFLPPSSHPPGRSNSDPPI